MPRADLLALTPDDLAVLTNRGSVKRAQKELESGEPSFQLREEPSGDLVFEWSDGVVCKFPAGRPIHDAVCSSGVIGISRHVVRSVLGYQRVHAAPAVAEAPPDEAGTSEPSAPVVAVGAVWDPGAITDDALAAAFRKTTLQQAKRRFEEGILVELTRGAKPVARFLDEGLTIRFLVPGDLRYLSADCAEALIPTWAAIAVWAFRALPADRISGLISLGEATFPVPRETLRDLSGLLDELRREGTQGIPDAWPQRLSRIESALRDEGLVWPAELTSDLAHQIEMYRSHDARFEPRRLVLLLGESEARSRAILNETKAVPQLLIRGSKSDRPAEIAGSRMIGVGLGVRPGRKHTTVGAYLQEVETGGVVVVERTFAAATDEAKPRSFTDLAATTVTRGVGLATLASSQLLLKSGKRTPGGVLVLPRTSGALACHPQNYQWEQLKPPLAAESFAELSARLESLPPSCLRPRRRTENLHVVGVAGAEEVEFDHASQRLVARLRDAGGGSAILTHPYHAQGRTGFDDLGRTLETRAEQVRFVCGHVRVRDRTLEIEPIAVVFEDAGHRFVVHPWIANPDLAADDRAEPSEESTESEPEHEPPLAEFLRRLEDLLADLLVTGVAQADPAAWRELARFAGQLGFARLSVPIASLADLLSERSNALSWDASPAVEQVAELCLMSRLAAE